MPIPAEYQRAADDFYKFLLDARDIAELGSTHQTYTMVQGVLQTFRRRLDVKETILFAGILPPVLRAIFVTDWNINERKRPFEDRATMMKEVQSLRNTHNFSPDNAIRIVAKALRNNIDEAALDEVLAKLPKGAVEFWKP